MAIGADQAVNGVGTDQWYASAFADTFTNAFQRIFGFQLTSPLTQHQVDQINTQNAADIRRASANTISTSDAIATAQGDTNAVLKLNTPPSWSLPNLNLPDLSLPKLDLTTVLLGGALVIGVVLVGMWVANEVS